MKKRLFTMLICCLLFIAMVIPCFSAEQQSEKKYDPLDLVVVVDSSGSMISSDPQRTAMAAVRMLVNMMPADSRVGVVGFNTKATVWTKDASGNPALLSLEDYMGAESVRDAVTNIQYNGGTGIGNAVHRATELLEGQKTDGRKKAIMLFTDGVDDFDYDVLGLSKCQENEVDAIQWAKENDTVIYCVGYNYLKPDGTYSMGAKGEGLVKLENIANSTGGRFRAISTIEEAEQLLVDFLADVCDLNYRSVATIPGDGGFHEVHIPISPSVVEANIRIAGGDADSIKNGQIRLYDPSGNELELRNSGNVRYAVDVTAASIKVIMPRSGEWLLTVKGINGDDIHIGLLEHFKMNLSSVLTFPEGNPEGVAYSNDVIGIKAWLTYDGANLTDTAVYEAVTSATATCISRANADEKKIVELKRNGMAFEGSFVIPEDSYYDVVIRLDWETVYREDIQEVKSSNKPLALTGKIETVKVNKGKSVTLDDIYRYVADDENDKITAAISNSTAPDAADIVIADDKITVTGKKWSSTLATVTYTDAQGNTVDLTFKVKVVDVWALVLIYGAIVLLALLALYGMYMVYKKSFKFSGKIRVAMLAERTLQGGVLKGTQVIYQDEKRRYKDPLGARPTMPAPPVQNDGIGGLNTQPAGGFGSDPMGGFGAMPTGGFGTNAADDMGAMSMGGFAAEPSGGFGGMSMGGLGDSFTTGMGTSMSMGGMGGLDGVMPDPAMQESTNEAEKDAELVKTFNGEMLLGDLSRKKVIPLKLVLDAFIKRFEPHMLQNNSREESALLKQVKDFVAFHFSSFENIKVEGTPRGRDGIVLQFPKDDQTVIYSAPKQKNKIATKNSKRDLVIFKFAVPIGDVTDGASSEQKEAYVEIEYINI